MIATHRSKMSVAGLNLTAEWKKKKKKTLSECNFNKYTNAVLMFAQSSIVLSAYSYSGSQGPGAGPSIDCREKLEKKIKNKNPWQVASPQMDRHGQGARFHSHSHLRAICGLQSTLHAWIWTMASKWGSWRKPRNIDLSVSEQRFWLPSHNAALLCIHDEHKVHKWGTFT